MPVIHEEHRNLVASELSTIVEQLDQLVGNSTWRSGFTNYATFDAGIVAQSLLVHSADVSRFQIARRNLKRAVDMTHITDADIGQMNDEATSRQQFIDNDSTLAGGANGTGHRFGGTR